MNLRSPDAVLWRYIELKESLSSPRTSTALKDMGLMPVKVCETARCPRCWDKLCPKCGTRRCRCRGRGCHSRVYRFNRDMQPLCVCCGKHWVYELTVCGPGDLPHWRVGTQDDRLSELGTLVVLLQKPKLWERRAWMLCVTGQLTLRDAADEARRLWPRAPFAWNKDRVARLMAAARMRVGRQLERARARGELAA